MGILPMRFRGDFTAWKAVPRVFQRADEGLPTTWTATENVKWVADVPGWGWSCPIVCGDRVIYADGGLISFQIEAHDEHEPIARATHKLRVIEATRLRTSSSRARIRVGSSVDAR